MSEPASTPASVADQLRRSLDQMDADEAPPALALAAAAEDPVRIALATDLSQKPPHVHRIPLGIDPRARFGFIATAAPTDSASTRQERPEGSFAARAFGNVVHRYLEFLASLLAAGQTATDLRGELPGWLPRLTASMRGEGVPPALAAREAERVLHALNRMLDDATALWILAPHPEASSEWAVVDGGFTRRADRTFVAGAEPLSSGDSHLWIVDFKTSEQGARSGDTFRSHELTKYRAQLEGYAASCRAMAGRARPIRLGLFYPLDGVLLEWESEPSFAS